MLAGDAGGPELYQGMRLRMQALLSSIAAHASDLRETTVARFQLMHAWRRPCTTDEGQTFGLHRKILVCWRRTAELSRRIVSY